MRQLLYGVILIFIAGLVMPTMAQSETPPEVDTVIQTLEAALGVDIDPTTIDSVVWREVSFPTTALGCPFPQTEYEYLNATGYQVVLDYEGVRYDYRVTLGSELVALCGTQEVDFVVPTDSPPVVIATETVPVDTPNSVCADALPTRLAIGQVARTTPILGSNIRELPDLDATEVGLIPESTEFTVTEGPECGADGNYWWGVSYSDLIGWVVQGQNDLYFVEPIPTPLAASVTPISLGTVDLLAPFSVIEGNLLGISAWSPDGQRLVIADASTANPALWVYFIGDLSQVPISVPIAFDVTALAFSPDGSLLAVGDPDGFVHLLETESYTQVESIAVHDTAVLSIEFSPVGNYMVVIDDNYSVAFYGTVAP